MPSVPQDNPGSTLVVIEVFLILKVSLLLLFIVKRGAGGPRLSTRLLVVSLQVVDVPLGSFQEAYALFHCTVGDSPIELPIEKEVVEGALALRACSLFFECGPLEDAVGTVEVFASFYEREVRGVGGREAYSTGHQVVVALLLFSFLIVLERQRDGRFRYRHRFDACEAQK